MLERRWTQSIATHCVTVRGVHRFAKTGSRTARKEKTRTGREMLVVRSMVMGGVEGRGDGGSLRLGLCERLGVLDGREGVRLDDNHDGYSTF